MIDTTNQAALAAALGAFFPEHDVEARPGAGFSRDGKDFAAVLWYIDARTVMRRLDLVFGPANWQTKFETAFDRNMVVCHLSCRVGGEWVTKCDVGALSEQPDEGDRYKAAFSDSLKRAAVHWGIGRYLYDIPFQSAEYNKQRKRFVNEPRIPKQFLPKPIPAPAAQAAPKPETTDDEKDSAGWRDLVSAMYDKAKTTAEFQAVNQHVRENPQIREAMSKEDAEAVHAAAVRAKKRCEENDLIAATPYGG